MIQGRKFAVVLGGGGLRGLAHIGALKALHRFGLIPDEYVGASVGSLIAAMAAGGMKPEEIEEVALTLRPEDILDYQWLRLLWRRARARSLCRGKALHDFVRRVLPEDRFDRLLLPLYVTSVELDSAQEVIWGMPGFRDVPVHDCVVASCSIPGIYPPKRINQYSFVDGSLVDTLPVKVAVYNKADLILAVYLEPAEPRPRGAEQKGIAAILQQSQSILSRTLARHNLHFFEKAPIILVQPRVGDHGMFEFQNTAEMIDAGEAATEAALRDHPLTRNLLPPLPDRPATAVWPVPPPLPRRA